MSNIMTAIFFAGSVGAVINNYYRLARLHDSGAIAHISQPRVIVTQFYVSLLFSGILGFIAYGLFASSLLQGTCFPSSNTWSTLCLLADSADPGLSCNQSGCRQSRHLGLYRRFFRAIRLMPSTPSPRQSPSGQDTRDKGRANRTLPPWMQTGLPGIRMKYTGAACCSRIAITDKHLTPASTQQCDAMTKTLIRILMQVE